MIESGDWLFSRGKKGCGERDGRLELTVSCGETKEREKNWGKSDWCNFYNAFFITGNPWIDGRCFRFTRVVDLPGHIIPLIAL